LVYFAGCDYFRLASHPRVLAALQEGVRRFGFNVSASRLTTGNHALYGRLEEDLANFFGVPAALLVSTGYLTNLVVAQGLEGCFARAYIDQKAHSSLKDATQFLGCRAVAFAHCDPKDLARVVRGDKSRDVIVLTDGMFSHNGAIAPLRGYRPLLPTNSVLLVDDAHGTAVLGKTGRGTVQQEGINRERVIQTITLSKAFGTYGGAILASKDLRDRLVRRSALFAGSTPLPLPLARAAIEAVRIIGRGTRLRERLWSNVAYLKKGLRESGISVPERPSPIVAFGLRTPADAPQVQARLLAAGIHPPLIRYQAAPPEGYFRFAISSEHSREHLDRLSEVLIECRTRLVPL
jgi:7-keto-8-aminopelargonate synthetase-like enzyme